MGRSNRNAVESANIDPDVRLDFTVPRNAGRTLHFTVTLADGTVPTWFPGSTIVAKAKTSYEATAVALTGTVSNRDDTTGEFDLTWDASKAKGLGIDVEDLVFDVKCTPTDTSLAPVPLGAGLMLLSKGVS